MSSGTSGAGGSGLNYQQIIDAYKQAAGAAGTEAGAEGPGLQGKIDALLKKGEASGSGLSQTDLLQLQALMAQLSTLTTVSSQLISSLARSLGDLAKNIN